MATAELAMALPALVMVVSLLITIVGAASDASRLSEAARAGARSASIGTDRAVVIQQTKALAPENADVRLWVEGPWVRIELEAPGRHWGPLPLPAPTAVAAALLEPGVTP
ncbi:MAG: TadE family type IV pilus minor pilin [Actinomycetes bacterium]